MTDEQIIIDGVDVSGCNLYRDEVSFIGGEIITDICSIWIWQRDYKGLEPSCVMKCHCFDNPNCYYKQLKRKEQECEELKKECENWESLCKHADKQIDELEAELEALKSFDINLVGIKECEIIQLLQYRNALTEIREIARVLANIYPPVPMKGMNALPFVNTILDKISEVLDVASD